MFDGLAERLLFLLIVFSVLIGWHPVLINVFFDFTTLFIEWPRSYYLFSQEARHYDLAINACSRCYILSVPDPVRNWCCLCLPPLHRQPWKI